MSKPFTPTNLRDIIMSDRDLYEDVKRASLSLVRAMNRAATHAAKTNAEWHDDPKKDDYNDFHASADDQYPPKVRYDCAIDVLDYFMKESLKHYGPW